MCPREHQADSNAHSGAVNWSGDAHAGGGRWDVGPAEPGVEPGEGPRLRGEGSRLNLLISYGGWREESAVNQLPRLLEPMGIRSIRADSGEEATDVLSRRRVHIAMVDLAVPLRRGSKGVPAGPRLLTLLRRLEQPPPTVVLRPQQVASRESARTLSDALREGAFAVLDRPVDLETVLEVMRRVLQRYYADHWPGM